MHRLFVALRLPEGVRDLLVDACDESADFRWVSDDHLHVTLRFVGEVEAPMAEDLMIALGSVRFGRFALRIAGTGRFERKGGGALWAEVEPREQVAALAAKVDRACVAAGLPPEHRAFHPHVTLARWSGRRGREVADFLDRTRGLASLPFAIDGFTLFESHLSRHGPHYEAVADYPLV